MFVFLVKKNSKKEMANFKYCADTLQGRKMQFVPGKSDVESNDMFN